MQCNLHIVCLLARSLIGLALSGVVVVGTAGNTRDQENAPQSQTDHPFQGIHGPRSIDQELDHLTKELELTPKQRKQIRPLLEEHHDRIQALLDKNPTLSREALQPQIHAISDQTHHEIEALLTEHQRQLAKAMQKRMHHEEQGKRPPSSGASS